MRGVRDAVFDAEAKVPAAGEPVAAFLQLMSEHHVSAFDFDESDLDREFASTGSSLQLPGL